MTPREVGDLSVAVVDELDRPATFELDPDEDDAAAVAGGELLVRLVPLDKCYFGAVAAEVVVGARRRLAAVALRAAAGGVGDADDAAAVADRQPAVLFN